MPPCKNRLPGLCKANSVPIQCTLLALCAFRGQEGLCQVILKRCQSEGSVHKHPTNLQGNKEPLVAQTAHRGLSSGVRRWCRWSPSASWSFSTMPAGTPGWDQGGAHLPSSFGFVLQSQTWNETVCLVTEGIQPQEFTPRNSTT